MDLKSHLINLPVNRAVSSIAVLFLILLMGALPGTAIASSAGGGSVTTDNDQLLQLSSTKNNTTDPDDQSMDYLLAVVSYVDDTLSLLDPNTGQVLARTNVGYGPISVMPRPDTMDAAVLLTNAQPLPLTNLLPLPLPDREGQKIVFVNMTTQQIYGAIALKPDTGGIGTISNDGCVDHMFWRPDGRYLYVLTDTYLVVINTVSLKVDKYFDVAGAKIGADISPDGSQIILFQVLSDYTYKIDRLNTTTNTMDKSVVVQLNFSAKNVGPLKFSPDGSKAYMFIDDMSLSNYVWGWWGWEEISPCLCIIDSKTLSVETIEHALPTHILNTVSDLNRMDLEITPDGKNLYMLYSDCKCLQPAQSKIVRYCVETRACLDDFNGDCQEMSSIAISPDYKIYATDYCDCWARTNKISIIDAYVGHNNITGHITVGDGPMDVKIVPVAKAGSVR